MLRKNTKKLQPDEQLVLLTSSVGNNARFDGGGNGGFTVQDVSNLYTR